MVLNSLDTPQPMAFNLTESWAVRAGRLYEVYDMWAHTKNGTAYRGVELTVPAHGVAALLLNDAGPEPEGVEPYCAGYWQCSFPNGMPPFSDCYSNQTAPVNRTGQEDG